MHLVRHYPFGFALMWAIVIALPANAVAQSSAPSDPRAPRQSRTKSRTAQAPQTRSQTRSQTTAETRTRAAQPSSAKASSAAPAKSNDGYQPNWPDPPNTGALLLRLGLGTVFVLVLCAGTLWFGRNWLSKVSNVAHRGNQLRLEESTSLGNRCHVHLLTIGNCRILAGTDSTGLKSLLTLPEAFDDVLGEQMQSGPTGAETASTAMDHFAENNFDTNNANAA